MVDSPSSALTPLGAQRYDVNRMNEYTREFYSLSLGMISVSLIVEFGTDAGRYRSLTFAPLSSCCQRSLVIANFITITDDSFGGKATEVQCVRCEREDRVYAHVSPMQIDFPMACFSGDTNFPHGDPTRYIEVYLDPYVDFAESVLDYLCPDALSLAISVADVRSQLNRVTRVLLAYWGLSETDRGWAR